MITRWFRWKTFPKACEDASCLAKTQEEEPWPLKVGRQS